jgi:large subunit ribosomal protein L35
MAMGGVRFRWIPIAEGNEGIMPKMRTHRGAAKRFRLSGSGKVMRRKATGNHKLIKKSGSRRRRITGMTEVGPERNVVKRLLGT